MSSLRSGMLRLLGVAILGSSVVRPASGAACATSDVLLSVVIGDSFGKNLAGVYGNTNSRPYRGAASNILCTSPYADSCAGGNVIAGAGTLNSLKKPSSPAGVRSMSVRNCSDSIAKECATSRGRQTIVPGVALKVRSPTETVISPSST